jgi:predicted ribosomally synthesized peptide with SipW-like signal peptide
MKISKRRFGVIAAAVGALGALTALGLGGTSALYTSQADGQNNSIESGTIQLNNTSAVSDEIHLTGFMPGDTSPTSKYKLAYSGEDAFVGLDVVISSTALNPCTFYHGGATGITPSALLLNCTDTGTVPMFDGDHTSGSLDLAITPTNGNTAHQIFNPGDLEPGTSCSADTNGLVTCTVEKNNVIVPPGSVAGAADDLVWSTGTTDMIRLSASLPHDAGNIFQGSVVDIDLTAHAVQYANNHVLFAGFEGLLANGVSTAAPVQFPDTF